jgi:hypothetical protein
MPIVPKIEKQKHIHRRDAAWINRLSKAGTGAFLKSAKMPVVKRVPMVKKVPKMR